MKTRMLVLSGLMMLSTQFGFAGELDSSSPSAAPKGLIVRAAPGGTQDVFAADVTNIANDSEAAAAIQKFVTPAQLVQNIVPSSELDRTTSAGAWCSWYNPYYSGYGYYGYSYYYNYGYSYSYVPYYNYYYGGYNYYYYQY